MAPQTLADLARLEALRGEARAAAWREGARVWADLGNPEQALRWARLGPEPAPWEAAWASERARQSVRLAANAAAAGRRGPPALPDLRWDEAGDRARGVTWIVRDGRTDLVDLRGGGAPALLPAAVPESVLASLRGLAASGNPFLLGPLPDPRLAAEALAAQPPLFLTMRPAAFMIEPDLARFRMLVRLFDLAGPLGADHALWFVGDGWRGRLASFLRAHPGVPVPGLRAVIAGGLSEDGIAGLLAEATAWREGEALRLEGEAARIYAAARPWGGRPRVLVVTSRFTTVLQHSARDLAEAFRSLGGEAEVVLEARDCEWSSMHRVRQRLCAWRPDLVVQLDHLRAEFGAVFPPDLPYACWVQDRLPHLFERRLVSALGPRDFTFSWWPAMTRDLLAAGYPEVLPLPPGANDRVYRLPERPLEPVCDVAFVSNLSVPRDPEGCPGLAARAEAILSAEGIGWRDPAFYAALLARLERELRIRVKKEARGAVLHFLSFDVERWVQRAGPVRWARAMGLDARVWGRGWADSPEFSPVAMGPVAPGGPLRDLYASARIHLHLNSDTNVHARVFECLLSGGFLLAGAHPSDGEPGGLASALEVGREVETFAGREDFERHVRRYLADEGARRAVSEAGRARVLRDHTMARRAGTILEAVRGR